MPILGIKNCLSPQLLEILEPQPLFATSTEPGTGQNCIIKISSIVMSLRRSLGTWARCSSAFTKAGYLMLVELGYLLEHGSSREYKNANRREMLPNSRQTSQSKIMGRVTKNITK